MSTISSELWPGLNLDPKTAEALSRFARRRRALMLLRTVAVGLVSLVAMMAAVACCDYLWLLSESARWLLSLTAYLCTLAAIWRFGLRGYAIDDPQQLARQIESAAPRLREDLLSAVELADPELANGSAGFRERLQRNVARRAALLDMGLMLPVGLVQRWLLSGLVVATVCGVMLLIPDMQFGRRIARAMLPGAPIQRASLTELTILQPSPPSGYVAEGDAVGVVVRVGGVTADNVMIEWRSDDGVAGESIMSPRAQSPESTSSGTLPVDDLFAANLAIGAAPIEYRVIAGDAITLWHELTPLPRPRVESFSKRYHFPSYARLADRVEQAEHGDLRAIVGTLAEVTVRFDEPVYDATLRFGSRGVTTTLEPVDDSDREFMAPIPIKTPANYQIDAYSVRSGLNNPFSPQYSVTPVIDTPPVVSWAPSITRSMVVAPVDVVSLAAAATDDLPMERVIQEFQVNSELVARRQLRVGGPARELELAWDWDLLHRTDDDEPSQKLSGGDIIRTRVVGIDRRGQRGESTFIELLIAEQGFDTNRHDRLHELSGLSGELADWADGARDLMRQMKDTVFQSDPDSIDVARETADGLHSRREEIFNRIQIALQTSPNRHQATTLELCGRALLDIDRQIAAWFSQYDLLSGERRADGDSWRERHLRDLSNQANRDSQSASRVGQYARAILGEELTVAIVADALSLQRSLQPMLDEASPLPNDRFPRYLKVAVGRLDEIGELIDQHSPRLPESTRRHLENWLRWRDSWHERLETAAEETAKSDARRSLVTKFDVELRRQIDNGMIDGRLASTVINLVREIRSQIGSASDLQQRLAAEGERAVNSLSKAENEDSSDDAAWLNLEAQIADAKFTLWNSQLLDRLQREEELHRRRPNADQQYAADLNLMHRAVSNVTKQGYAAYEDEPPAAVHRNLSSAFRVLEGKHEAEMWLAELRALMMAERQLEENAIAKIKHPTWLERFSVGLDWPMKSLRRTEIERPLVDRIERARSNVDFQKAKQRITSRRWGGEAMLTGELQLDDLRQELHDALAALEPDVLRARATIERYVLTLAQQARQAAELARQAQQRTETRSDSSSETAEQLADQQQPVAAATQETLESLVDFANTAGFTDESQRELARDADAASAQIQSAADRAQQAIEQAAAAADDGDRAKALDQTAEALEELADSLDQTADHFERADSGQDVSDSRAQLREAEQALFEDELQDQYDRAEALAKAMESSPQELMERLERELEKNQPMQQELSEISQQAAAAAQRSLEKAARDESSLNQSLERSDSVYQERKLRAAHELENLAQRAATVDDALLDATERAVGWANAPEMRPKLNEARESLREVMRQSDELKGEPLLSEMRSAAAEMSRSIAAATEAVKEINGDAQPAQQDDIHRDSASRKKAQDQLERFANDARTKRIRAASREKSAWDRAERDAGRRVQQAQRQQRDAERGKRQVEQQIDRNPDSAEALAARVADLQQRIASAERTEQEAKETRTFSDQRGKEVDERAKQLRRDSIDPLKMENPAAQLAVQMTERASEELDQIRGDLERLAEQTQFGDQLRAPASSTQQLARQQQSISQDVADAGEQLRRAARHEQRLGKQQMSAQLDAAADAVTENALAATREAGQSLRQASDDDAQSPQANRMVGAATEQINAAAQQLAQLLASAAAAQDESAAGQASEPSAAEQRGQQLAQTLDELDRAMSQPPGEPQQGEAGQSQPSQSGEQTAQQSQQQSSQQTAGEASPTLAEAMNNQSQQAARRRQQQINPNAPGQSQGGQQSNPNASTRDSQIQGGSGEMPTGGIVDTMGISRVGSEWGQLRERRTEDATESRGAMIAPEYRREIEAYFRAIAKRAAENEP